MIDTGSAQIADSSWRMDLAHILMSRHASVYRPSRCRLLYGRGGAHLLVGDLEDPMCDQALTSPRYSWLIWDNARRRQEAVKVESHVPATNGDRFL